MSIHTKSRTHRIALVTYQTTPDDAIKSLHHEDTELLRYLQARGLDIRHEVWDDPAVNWTDYDIAVVKSTWDYFEKYSSFMHWLERMEQLPVRVFNSIKTIRWNSDKHYLIEIAESGLPVVPSIYISQGERPDIASFFPDLNTDRLIIKPCVSGGANNTIPVKVAEAEALQEYVHALLAEGSYIVQPFMDEIHRGEWSLFFFNGIYSHSTLKTPKSGDFRVQPHHGGQYNPVKAGASLVKQAGRYIEKFAEGTLYARVDALERDGQLILMELELIEPYLCLNTDENALNNYYEALLVMIKQ